jgi:hypothetical protein
MEKICMKKLLFIALFLSFGFSAFALTFDAGGGTINAYSSLRLFWQYQNIDIEEVDYSHSSLPIGAQSNSRLGFTFAKDNYGAQVELGLNLVAESPTLRLANFNYGFEGAGKFIIGLQTSLTGTDGFFSQKLNAAVNGGDDGAAGFGAISTERHAAVTFALEKNLASIQLIPSALYTSATDTAGTFSGTTRYSGYEVRQLVPIISLGFDGSKALEVPVKVGFTYALFSAIGDDNSTDPLNVKEDETFDVNAFVVSAAANPTFGPATISVAGFYSQNGNALGEVKGWGGGAAGTIGTVGFVKEKFGKVYDVTAYGAAAEVKFKASDTVTAALGGGYQQFSFDEHQNREEDASNIGIYANATIKLGNVFSITPEIDYLSFESTSNSKIKLNEIIVGAQLRLDI